MSQDVDKITEEFGRNKYSNNSKPYNNNKNENLGESEMKQN